MSSVYCPGCGNKHASSDRYCEYCGEDLEQVILRHKSERLPFKYKTEQTAYSGPVQQKSTQQYQRTAYHYEDDTNEYRRQTRRDNTFEAICSLLFCFLCCLDN